MLPPSRAGSTRSNKSERLPRVAQQLASKPPSRASTARSADDRPPREPRTRSETKRAQIAQPDDEVVSTSPAKEAFESELKRLGTLTKTDPTSGFGTRKETPGAGHSRIPEFELTYLDESGVPVYDEIKRAPREKPVASPATPRFASEDPLAQPLRQTEDRMKKWAREWEDHFEEQTARREKRYQDQIDKLGESIADLTACVRESLARSQARSKARSQAGRSTEGQSVGRTTQAPEDLAATGCAKPCSDGRDKPVGSRESHKAEGTISSERSSHSTHSTRKESKPNRTLQRLYTNEKSCLDDNRCPDLAAELAKTNRNIKYLKQEVIDLRKQQIEAYPAPNSSRVPQSTRAQTGKASQASATPSQALVRAAVNQGFEEQTTAEQPHRGRTMRKDILKLGAPVSGLAPHRTSFTRFVDVVNYQAYRLLDTKQEVGRKEYGYLGRYGRRLETVMDKNKFDGSEPTQVLQFLRTFKTQCDFNGITEGCAVLILPRFLEETALETYQSAVDYTGVGMGGVSSYPEAVHYLLQRFASDLHLEPAIERFEALRQRDDEEEIAFGKRLAVFARAFGGAYKETDLITRFIRGLNRSIKPLLTAERAEEDFKGCRTFNEVVERAHTLGESQRAFADTVWKRRPTSHVVRERRPDRKVNNVELLPSSSSGRTRSRSASATRADDIVALIGDDIGRPVTQVSTDDDTSESQRKPNLAEDALSPGSTKFYSVREGFDEVDLVQGDRKPDRKYTDFPNDICYRCFSLGRKAPNCFCKDKSDNDPHFVRFCKRNYDGLTDKQREHLSSVGRSPRWLVVSTGPAAPNYVAPPARESTAPPLGQRNDKTQWTDLAPQTERKNE